MTFGSLFSGIGGIDLGLERAGMTCKWQVEIDSYSSRVLAKHWHVTRYRDVRLVNAFDHEGWRFIDKPEPVDLLAGGFPCQDISTAGSGVGIIGERSGLWKEFARLVADLRPKFVFAENVPALRNRGLAMVLQDLWSLGFDAEWHCIPASSLGANHERDRIWIVGYPAGLFREAIIWGEPHRDIQADAAADTLREGWEEWSGCTAVPKFEERWEFSGRSPADATQHRRRSRRSRGSYTGYSWQRQQPFQTADVDCARLEEPKHGHSGQQPATFRSAPYIDGEPLVRAAIARGERHAWTIEPGVVRMVHGVPNRVDRLRGLGNAVVPQVVEWIGRRILLASRLKVKHS